MDRWWLGLCALKLQKCTGPKNAGHPGVEKGQGRTQKKLSLLDFWAPELKSKFVS